MARKKKEKTFIPSKYQERILDFVEHGVGNAVIEANAGCGKTTTLISCVDKIDEDSKILLTSFNRDIVNELKKRTKEKTNVTCATIHSLGLQILQRNMPTEALALDEFKYKTYINTNIKSLTNIDLKSLSKNEYVRYIDNINKYVNFGRYYLSETVRDLDMIEERYDIETLADEKEVATDVIHWGISYLDTIDYEDMIYLPNMLNCKAYGLQFDWIMVDEAQDLSVAQRKLLFKCIKINTRTIWVGDKNQSLYSFSGSDPESFSLIKKLPNTISLPLSISYRCADKIVEFSQNIVPSIEKNNDGREGEIVRECDVSDVEDGDMILCRNNAPLMQIYIQLLKLGKKAFIRGKDIGLNMKHMIKGTKIDSLGKNLDCDGVFPRLYNAMFDIIHEIMAKSNVSYEDAVESEIVERRYDTIKALYILSEGIETADELIKRIDEVFSNRKISGISLSTVHKAKGLEANNVYIACESLMPSKRAKKDWEIEQERNLIYVAYTRAKNKLGFISEKDFNTFNESTRVKVAKLQEIEIIINALYKKKPKHIDVNNPYIAREIIKHATDINKKKETSKIFNINNINSINQINIKNKKRRYVL